MISAADAPLLAVFAAVVQRGSFSAAALQLKLSKSVVSERVKLLEERCGARLLERTTRRLMLTALGEEVLATTARVEDEFGLLAQRLDAARREPSGVLRVSTTNDLGPLLVGPVVARFVAAYPRVRVEIISDDAQRDLLGDKVDVAVRLGAPKASSFVVRKLCELTEPIVAAPTLADALGRVVRPRELAAAPWVRHSLVAAATMRFHGPGGEIEEIAPTVRAEANTGATVLGLLLHGAGVGVLPEHALREHLHEGRLVCLCPGWIWKRVTLYAVMPSRASQRPALSAFLAMLREQIARDRMRWSDLAR
ncbi:MAG: LysR substrate-binding domain-containing protein [Proteobacteria bacterium]|nr:LysR substrate-binding domain-containing protein [Pseudomonadota bacterium]